MEKQKPAPKRATILRRVAIVATAVIVLAVGGFLLWAGDYYHAEPEALAVLDEEGTVDEGGDIALMPEGGKADCAIVFYPGAKVQAEAYLPILDQLRDRGIACFLARMPLNLAFFDIGAASSIIDAHPDIETRYVAGHSLGGSMASAYASDNEDRVSGLILMGSYVYGDYPPSNALTVYGSLNTSVEDSLTYTENVVEIEGGNHAQFGNYGPQGGDAEATISAADQQEQTVNAVVGFIDERSPGARNDVV